MERESLVLLKRKWFTMFVLAGFADVVVLLGAMLSQVLLSQEHMVLGGKIGVAAMWCYLFQFFRSALSILYHFLSADLQRPQMK